MRIPSGTAGLIDIAGGINTPPRGQVAISSAVAIAARNYLHVTFPRALQECPPHERSTEFSLRLRTWLTGGNARHPRSYKPGSRKPGGRSLLAVDAVNDFYEVLYAQPVATAVSCTMTRRARERSKVVSGDPVLSRVNRPARACGRGHRDGASGRRIDLVVHSFARRTALIRSRQNPFDHHPFRAGSKNRAGKQPC